MAPEADSEDRLMNTITLGLDELIVVDARVADYDALLADPALANVRTCRYTTGEAALRTPTGAAAALWMINMHLPDASGVALLRAVARRSERPSIFLVGDVYSPEDELAARTAGAASYFCKPASAAWLEGYRQRIRAPSVRAGPAFCPAREHS
jgi:DNA-binding response OmpR family regulator